MSITQALLRPLLDQGSPRPLITHYDDAVGSRVELSRATMANWAAKTANWLVDELDLEPGMPVAVRLPAHWQTAGIMLGSWWCGAHITDDPRGAEVAFVPATGVDAGNGAHTVAAVSLDPLGGEVRELPEGTVDYIAEVRVHGDDFFSSTPVAGETPALHSSTVDEVLARVSERVPSAGITSSDRVLSTRDWNTSEDIIDGFLVPLAAGASVVQCGHVDVSALPARRSTERTTVELGDHPR